MGRRSHDPRFPKQRSDDPNLHNATGQGADSGRPAEPAGPPSRDFGYGLRQLRLSPGARKEQVRRREYRPRRRVPRRYVELHAASAFSFLDGASLPEDLVARAAELGLPAMALLDRNGVAGAPRFHKAAKEAGTRALVGAEVVLADRDAPPTGRTAKMTRREAAARSLEGHRLALLVRDARGYRNLCKLLTAAARGRPKGDARVDWGLLRQHAAGLHCLTGGAEGLLAHELRSGGMEAGRGLLGRLRDLFSGHVHVELQRHHLRSEEQRNQALVELAHRLRLPLVATGGVRYATPRDKPLFDVLTCARHYTHVDAAGARLDQHRERYLKSAEEMFALFADLPRAVEESVVLADQLEFTLADLGYRFPDFPLPPGETAASFLRQVTWNEARARFRPLTARAQAQLEKELGMIEKLDLAGYFLIVWDLIRFCKREGIMAQGRGSAANSAVCYALSITAVDPVRMELLFERFLSEERGEWPDIDLDLPSGDQREKVIQYVYSRYGPHGAAMTANVITYRDKLAAREVGKALGFSMEQVGKLSKRLGRLRYDVSRGDERDLAEEIRAAGFDPGHLRVRHFLHLWQRIKNLPRHLGQHSGGMIVAQGRLDEVVPLEPASMPGRVVVQWDKDDCADLGIIKVDLLGLGMLNALEEAVPLIGRHEGVHVDLAHLPEDDPKVFDMLRRADTVGVFQVESRAQMASLPRNDPKRFYDLVIQVAIIRPGPIVGGMVHPFFDRRQGRAPVRYPHPSLEPILKRTLGVPIFQEQLLRIAMVAAGFSGGEAEELRRAMGFKRSAERMEAIERRLRSGMSDRGIVGEVQDQIVQSITSFALYGFPESHAASFALIAYASAYLKAHHPTAFYVSLLNAWPMGFYHPSTLLKDAERHGVRVLPIDATRSDWRCTWEDLGTGGSRGAASGPVLASSGSHPFGMASGDGDGGRRDDEGARLSGTGGGDAPLRSLCSGPEAGGTGVGGGGVGGGVGGGGKGGREEGRRYLFDRRRRGEPRGEAKTRQRQRQRRGNGGEVRGAIRLGLRYVRGLKAEVGARIEAERRRRPFDSLEDLTYRCGLDRDALDRLSYAGALVGFGMTRREAVWQAARLGRKAGPLLAALPGEAGSPLAEMSPLEETAADFQATGLTPGPHPMAYARGELRRRGVTTCADLEALPSGRKVAFAGSVIVRQRPGTAKGMPFLTLEDETGMAQAIFSPDLLARRREVIVGANGLVIEGMLQRRDGSMCIKAEEVWPIERLSPTPSHDWH
ncbi:MAG: error-prone DNA polymerase [Acidobacteriota bacterium]